jgi:hypothetical protein
MDYYKEQNSCSQSTAFSYFDSHNDNNILLTNIENNIDYYYDEMKFSEQIEQNINNVQISTIPLYSILENNIFITLHIISFYDIYDNLITTVTFIPNYLNLLQLNHYNNSNNSYNLPNDIIDNTFFCENDRTY